MGLSLCVTTGMSWMDRPSRAAGTSGELRARIDGSGSSGGVAYKARKYKQGWAGRGASRWPKLSQAILAYFI